MDLPHLDVSYLIVDSSRFSREALKQILEKRGYHQVRLLDNCESAMESLRETPADILILDWDIESKEPEEFCKAVRHMDNEMDRYTGILIAASDEDEDMLLEAYQNDINDFVIKPVREFELITRVNSVLQVAESRRTTEKKLFYIEQLNRLLVQKNVIDPLTQLGNKNFLMRELKSQMMDVFKRGGGFNLSLIEINSGKSLDNNAVKKVSQRIRNAIRPADPLCRIDDSHFAVVMRYKDDVEFNNAVFDRIRQSVGGKAIKNKGKDETLGIEIGSCFYEGEEAESNPAQLLSCAASYLEDEKNQHES